MQNRECIIDKQWKDELYKYITGIIQNPDHRLLAINGMPDHLHVLFGMRPSQSLSDLLQDIKGDSSQWINNRNFVRGKFSWQEAPIAIGGCVFKWQISNLRGNPIH